MPKSIQLYIVRWMLETPIGACMSNSLPIIDWSFVCQSCAHSFCSREWRDSQRWLHCVGGDLPWGSLAHESGVWHVPWQVLAYTSANSARDCKCLTTFIGYDFYYTHVLIFVKARTENERFLHGVTLYAGRKIFFIWQLAGCTSL